MPNWLYNAIWCLWVVWTIQQVGILWAIADHNSNAINVMLNGRYSFKLFGIIKLYAYIVLTSLWLCYAIFR